MVVSIMQLYCNLASVDLYSLVEYANKISFSGGVIISSTFFGLVRFMPLSNHEERQILFFPSPSSSLLHISPLLPLYSVQFATKTHLYIFHPFNLSKIMPWKHREIAISSGTPQTTAWPGVNRDFDTRSRYCELSRGGSETGRRCGVPIRLV